MERTIYDLGLHDQIYIEKQDCYVVRVSGGWLYKYYKEIYDSETGEHIDVRDQIIFVPYDEEFKKQTER